MSDEPSREELAERVADLEDTVDSLVETVGVLEFRGVDDPADADVSDIWISGHPIGLMVDKRRQQVQELEDRVDSDTDVSSDNGIDRSALLPLHKMWLDVREGDDEQLAPNDRRAARVFIDFFRKADPSYGTYSYSSGQAKDHLSEVGDPQSPSSKTVTRVFRRVQSFTAPKDSDEPPLITLDDTQGTNYLVSKKDRFNAYMKRAQAAIEGESIEIADDDASSTTDASEDPSGVDHQDVDAEMDQLLSAGPSESSDTVVSTDGGTASEGGDATPRKD